MPLTTTAERSLPALASTQKPFLVFPVSCPAEEGNDGVVLVGIWCLAEVSSPQPHFSEQTFPPHSFSLHLSHPSTSTPSLPLPLAGTFPCQQSLLSPNSGDLCCLLSLLGYEAASNSEWRWNHHSASCVSSPELLTQDSLTTNINPASHTFGVWFLVPRVINWQHEKEKKWIFHFLTVSGTNC